MGPLIVGASKRTDFTFPSSHSIRITPYWLLGLIEGEATFCLMNPKTLGVSFSISLTSSQLFLLEAIKEFLGNLLLNNNDLNSPLNSKEVLDKVVFIYIRDKRAENAKPTVEITIKQIQFLAERFRPFLNKFPAGGAPLGFVSKKYKDFLDWSLIVYLINKGKHTTEGKKLIIQLSNRMNNNRLSTNDKINVAGGMLREEVDTKLL